ncbi:TIGR04282 family arsenosugar biosynthesis glycosyltransferase [Adhaeribacter radiodurans]|uniref:TIGR04282 family arsenosugar biosynthesis glycosyltransferase n=1 Tax=Adhaeribacter radiodurans TaxID=2745197 RepID=A0A7L7L7A9_9BACT|nr:TIGR04282 family arsenosugar biosynthesis glycosyltransferase [Adhaeribacter radiodurans]QMU28690.1 TIGR04282 family arsenosugar biosynthesis glycosyltransferase [Adhaeribacter radiodurans]
MNKKLLLIFVKNEVFGKVKTRLAASIGEEKALQVYKVLLKRTYEITLPLPVTKAVYYSDFIQEDNWSPPFYDNYVQSGQDLGERMQHAFEQAFTAGYEQVCIIGSDCYELTEEIILQAFDKLERNDVVIGPAQDGGYYLLGMKVLNESFFKGKKWSTDSVLPDTLNNIKAAGQTVALLPELTDVDEEKDLITIREHNF